MCGVVLVVNSGRYRYFGRRMDFLTRDFTSRDIEYLAGWCLVGAGAAYYRLSGSDDDSDDESVGGSAKQSENRSVPNP